ncbi:MAG: hypothetical protein KBG20_06280 [Caldilineaceae bacterium]|nr:hypothetical protein [Caldilineaceae bacterium]MBP8105967.1 hypothetical protein [Caldilineaceae bacterium]MBP8124907.1 hypothetical protein [Caldilineaceae bacterium]MBP9071887.1 hypothetical protein [Caldilineaceae bacterium]
MTNFVLLYMGGTMPEDEAMIAEVMAAWGAWYGKMGAAVVDGGNPFSGSKLVTNDGISDGPTDHTGCTGYTIISADSMDDAVAKVKDHPHLNDGGQISVYETFEMSM